MDARTRERLHVLPVLVSTVDERRKNSAALLAAARRAQPGEAFTAAGQALTRPVTKAALKTWAEDPATGRRRDLGLEEDHAFWAWLDGQEFRQHLAHAKPTAIPTMAITTHADGTPTSFTLDPAFFGAGASIARDLHALDLHGQGCESSMTPGRSTLTDLRRT
jgi:hypothetical protein